MAKTYLGDWGTYYFISGTSTPNSEMDFQVRWDLKYEQNITNSKTIIYIQPYIKFYTSGNQYMSISPSITTNINSLGSKTQTINMTINENQSGNIYKYGTTYSYEITHDTSGNASCSFKGNFSYHSVTRTASHTWTLPTINMASSITNNTSASSRIDFGKDITFTLTRPNDTVTHTLTYVENNQTITIGTGIGTSKTYQFPTSYINNLPNSPEKEYIVTCTSSNGTVSTTTVYLKVPDSYKPSVVLSVTDGNPTTKGWGIWVQNKSILSFSLTPTLSAGSPIKTYYTKINDVPYYEQNQTLDKFNYTGTVNIVSNVTDNRNRTSANQTKALTVYAYSNPTIIKCEVVRCNSSGTEDNDGTYGKIKCSYSISPCNNKNAKTLVVTYGTGSTVQTKTVTLSAYSANDKTSGSTYDFTGLDTTANHTFTFKLTDSFTTTEQNYIMPPSFVLVSYYKGGKGISFGQIATQDGFNVYLDTYFDKINYFNQGMRVKRLSNGFGTAGYMHSCTFKINYTYQNQIIMMSVTQRERFGNIYINFSGGNTNDPSSAYIYTDGNVMAYLYKSATSTWELYIQKSEAYDDIEITNLSKGAYSDITLTWVDNTVSSLPSGYITASKYYSAINITGNASTATKATQDGNGNNIVNTYATKSEASHSVSWLTVTTSKTWASGTVVTYSGVLENAIGVWIGGKVKSSNTSLSSMFVPISLITTAEGSFLINDEVYWVRMGMYRNGNDLLVVDRGRSSDGVVSTILVLKST